MASSDKPTAVHFTLIFFVMLSLILGVVTYLSYRDLSLAQADLESKTRELADANQGIATHIGEIDALKSAVGFNLADIGGPGADNTVIGELMKSLQANGRDLQAPNVAAMLTAMRTKIDQLENEVATKDAALKSEQDAMLALKAQYQEQMNQIQTSQAGSESTLQKFISERDEIVRQKDEELTNLRNEKNRIQNEKAGLQDEMERMRDDLQEQIASLELFNSRLRTELDQVTRVSFEKEDGTIRRVDNTTRTVWINLGEEDRLREQVTFSVYDQDHHGVGRGPEDIKGRVEVTRILGPHLSQARILEENIYRPMTEGDVVYSPVWSAGLVEKFAISGEIDFDRDGKSDRDQLHNILQHAGAEVSIEIDDEGYRHPEDAVLTQDTKFLVLGSIPDPAQYPSEDPNRERIKRMAEQQQNLEKRALQQGVRVLSLNDFLAFMGYKPTQRLFVPGDSDRYTIQGGSRNTDAGGRLNPQFSSGRTSELFRKDVDRTGRPLDEGARNYDK